MILRRGGGRTITILAVGLLLLDGVLLLLAGIWTASWPLAVSGAALVFLAALVGLYWRHYQRQLRTIEESREELRRQIRSLRDLMARREEE